MPAVIAGTPIDWLPGGQSAWLPRRLPRIRHERPMHGVVQRFDQPFAPSVDEWPWLTSLTYHANTVHQTHGVGRKRQPATVTAGVA